MIVQLAKGLKKTVHNGITVTTTSEPQKANGHNALILYFDMTAGTGTWTVKIQGQAPNGTYIDVYNAEGDAMSLASVTADKAQVFAGIPETFRIVATEDVNGATVTVGYELMSV